MTRSGTGVGTAPFCGIHHMTRREPSLSVALPGMTSAERLSLAADFPAGTRDEWRELVRGVLRKSGAEPDDVEAALSSRTYDGFDLRPLYTAEDTAPDGGFPGLPPHVRGGTPDEIGRAHVRTPVTP